MKNLREIIKSWEETVSERYLIFPLVSLQSSEPLESRICRHVLKD